MFYFFHSQQLAQKLGRGCDIKDEKDPKTNAKKEGSAENAAHVSITGFIFNFEITYSN